jgi:hypothetical protein
MTSLIPLVFDGVTDTIGFDDVTDTIGFFYDVTDTIG